MAHDLILGKTNRDWSCGEIADNFISATISTSVDETRQRLAESLVAKGDAQGLGNIVRSEIQANADLAVTLASTGKLPVSERKAFGVFMKKWVAYAGEKNGRYVQDDFMRILQFRATNRRFTERLAVFDRMSKVAPGEPLVATPLPLLQPAPGTALVPASMAPSGWMVKLGLGLGIIGLFLGLTRKF